MDVVILTITIVCLLLVALWFRRPDPRLPPFPARPLPLVGNLLNLKANPRPLFKKWSEQCGDIFSLYLGGTLVIVLNGYDLLNEALVKKSDVFSHRPSFFVDEISGHQGKGIILASGDTWKEHRSVTLSILRMLGLGKNSLANKIKEEISYFTDSLSSLNGKPTNISVKTNMSVSNVICSITFGRRFDYEDSEFQELLNILRELASEQQSVSIVNFMPWLQHLPGDLFKAKKLACRALKLLAMFKKYAGAKRQEIGNNEDTDSFIGAYIAEMDRKISKGTSTYMDDKNLVKLTYELFAAGTETVSTTITWSILYLLLYPNIQENLHREIEDVIGSDRSSNMEDMPKLAYLNAFIMEVQRLASVVPLSITHMCSGDTTLRGYTVPKGALIIPNLDSVLLDKKTWGTDVSQFKPERFIDANGKLIKPDQLIPFSIGNRICLGENLAKMELFLFLSTLIQRFQFLSESEASTLSVEPVFGIVASPPPYQVRLIERRHT